MKKQILILAIFTLAILAGNSKVYAQLDQYTTGIPALSCATAAEPLHPIAGVAYTYQMDGTTGAENADQWTWWATKDPSFITGTTLNNAGPELTTASGALLAVSANYNAAGATNSVDITWSPEILAGTEYQGDVTAAGTSAAPSPTFVVGYATGANCADNIQVYEINPVVNFTVDIANIDASGTTLAWDTPTNQCVSPVLSATYNNGSKELDMDYGSDTLYFEMVASNFVNDFTPTFTMNSGLVGTQTATVTLYASLADAQSESNVLGTDNWTSATTTWATGTQFTANTAAEVVDGVSLFVKVVIENNTEESLTDNVFSLAVDAIDDGGTGIWDMEEADCADPSSAVLDRSDFAEHTVTPRPTITHATVDTNATPANDVITKTP